jgi:hypothetical protein
MRAPHDETEELLTQPHVEPFVMRERAMSGWVRVGEEAVARDEDLNRWVEAGVGYAMSLPPS